LGGAGGREALSVTSGRFLVGWYFLSLVYVLAAVLVWPLAASYVLWRFVFRREQPTTLSLASVFLAGSICSVAVSGHAGPAFPVVVGGVCVLFIAVLGRRARFR